MKLFVFLRALRALYGEKVLDFLVMAGFWLVLAWLYVQIIQELAR